MAEFAVYGAGAWGTALAQAFAAGGRHIVIYGRDAAVVEEINTRHTNSAYLGAQVLAPTITASLGHDGIEAVETVVLAVPAQASRSALRAIGAEALAGKRVVLTAKGFEAGTLMRQSEILAALAPKAVPFVLSGPSFAEDVAAGRPTAVTLAGDKAAQTSDLAADLAGPALRPYASDDRVGVELAGGLKNVYALCCGAVEGASLGASARSALIARAFAEMSRLVAAMGGSATTLTGLAGLGDLTLSCTTPQSRNYRFGLALGGGQTAQAIMAGGARLAEGVTTAPVALGLAQKFGVDAPLIMAANRLIDGAAHIDEIVAGLMARPLKRED